MIYHIENNPSLWEVSGVTVPYSRYALKQYIESSQNDIFADKQLRLMIIDKTNNKVIGIVDLADFDPLHNRVAVGIVISNDYREQGYARQALLLLSKYSFGYLNLNQLYVYIPDDNIASLNLFTGLGFVRCGVLKEWLQTGNGYKDVYLLQCIKNS